MILPWDDDVFHQSDDVSAQIKLYPQNRWAGPYSFAIDFNERHVDSETWVIQSEVEGCHTEWSQCGRRVTATSPLPLLITFHLYSQWSSRFDNLKNIKLNMIWQIPSLVGNCKHVIHRGRCDDLWPNTSVMIHRPRGRIHSDDVWSASVMMSEFRLRAGSPPVSWY